MPVNVRRGSAMNERTSTTVGRRVELEVESVAHGGHCVARWDGRVVFVRHTLPGERVVAEITADGGGSFCRADAVRVLRSAPRRVEPSCPVSGPGGCGGCDWQHVSPRGQRELKSEVLRDQFHRIAGIDLSVPVEELPGGPLRWRTRMELVTDDSGRAGLRAHRSHRVVPLDDCPIAAEGVLRNVLDRSWDPGDQLQAVLDGVGQQHLSVTPAEPRKGRSGLVRGGTATEYAADRSWQLDAAGFWQVHSQLADTLARLVDDWAAVPRGGRAWDLYAGVGLFAGVLAARVGARGRVLAVESDRRAVVDGRRNLADSPQVRWKCGEVRTSLRAARRRDGSPQPVDVVVLDPPRKGAGRQVVGVIAAARPSRVVYVSCDPAALARDVATFEAAGYRLTRLRAFDAFPMTQHLECVALLSAGTAA